MSHRHAVQRLARSVRDLPEPAAEAPPTPADPEPRELAREMTRALAIELEQFRRAGERAAEQLDPSQPPPDWYVESLMKLPPEDVTFAHLERLARIDPALSEARWESVKEAARRDLASGWLAARSLELAGGSAWERACFHAMRQQLRRAWMPRHEGESLLVDEMAQYELVRLRWVGILAKFSRDPRTLISLECPDYGADGPRRQTAAAATLEASRIVERVQRLYQNALRALLSLRRGKPAVFVRHAGQVNVAAGPQLNVKAPPPSAEPPDPPLARAPTTE